ncbi:hypothetical protein NK718_18615 [Alsobacter sp. SYSU M60028]|uniref:TIR domain-containing protein n=1 Tax=Alsobacter ponti TaxID=2962936 RepID=A0ABT1LHF2_9HYPH|nr:hypothetical protein [Alsobacter ponti]MCP8940543.1 hypothetical protein [Alsobacter ponti]
MFEVFVAYASGNPYQADMITKAATRASNGTRRILPWSGRDASGSPISDSVESWIEKADAFVGDISVVNDNVTYELGLAIGFQKPVRLIRSEHVPFDEVKVIGLIDTMGHDPYTYQESLTRIFEKEDESFRWPEVQKNREQPVFVLQPSVASDASLRLTSAIKKIGRLKFRSFNPAEISRLNASEAYEHTMSSFGIVAFWEEGNTEKARKNNQRAAFIIGLARGHGIPAQLIAPENSRLPLDLQDIAVRWVQLSDLDAIISEFRNGVTEFQHDHVEIKSQDANLLNRLHCGDPTAENEASALSEYFLETEAYQKTLAGHANILVGRKGSGKTAVFLQVRDITRVNKHNIIVDLMPDGHQLIKLKEIIFDHLSLGSRKEFISAFWQYILWLEIAYKLLEKDEQRAYRDQVILKKYIRLRELFDARVDTGFGDFSERLKLLTQNIVERFQSVVPDGKDVRHLDSSKILEMVYGRDIGMLREEVTGYMKIKGFVFFLMDNLDRFWTPGGFNALDAQIVIGLAEAMQEIARKFRRERLDFRWSIFIRSDVYEFLIFGMADYGKLSVSSLEWSDRELLKNLFVKRIGASVASIPWNKLWTSVSVTSVNGMETLEFLVQASMMRPRYLIRLFETARRRAVTFNRTKIDESDYKMALHELGWQVMEDLDREITDLVPESADLLYELINQSEDLTPAKFRYMAGKRLSDSAMIERLLDVMLWNGSIGVVSGGAPKYIFDCGYKRPYLASIIKADPTVGLRLHPTLKSVEHRS